MVDKPLMKPCFWEGVRERGGRLTSHYEYDILDVYNQNTWVWAEITILDNLKATVGCKKNKKQS